MCHNDFSQIDFCDFSSSNNSSIFAHKNTVHFCVKMERKFNLIESYSIHTHPIHKTKKTYAFSFQSNRKECTALTLNSYMFLNKNFEFEFP